MNSLFPAVISVFLLLIGYRFYGRLAEKLWRVDPDRKTPAIEKHDGVDYIPARNWTILFGHHFASIAGAGPIIGPVIACCFWGWLPSLIWIVVGSIFIGAMHDFSSLMISVRHGGRSVADIAATSINYRTKIVFSMFVWLALVLVVAVFAAVAGKTLDVQPRVVIPTFGLILDAILIGLMIYRWNVNQVLSSILGILILFGLIYLGYRFPVSIPGGERSWIIVLLVYAFFASVVPVNILLQPRDFLAASVLFFGLIFGYVGLFITHPAVKTPAYLGMTGAQGFLYPMLFVVIACGAISGFHGLIASGTTAKQLPNERYAKRIGYGAMVVESILSVLAVLAVAAGLHWAGSSANQLIFPEIMRNEGWVVAFGKGYGELTKPIFGSLGILAGIIMLKTFVMTTLDSGTRIARYVGEELFGEAFKIRFLANRYLSTLVVIGLAAFLALGNWRAIWPVFGAANQLVAALTLLVISVYLLRRREKAAYTLWPGVFMLLTTILALIYQGNSFFRDGKLLLGSVSVVLLILALFVIREAIVILRVRQA